MRRFLSATFAAVLLALPASASAQTQSVTPTQDVYAVTAAKTEGGGGGDGGLPFTGLSIGIVAAAGLTLAGTGFVLRRTSRPE